MPRVSVEHEQQQRQKILQAATACFCRRGYHETSVQHICDEAGLSKGGLYTYFKSKEEVLAAVVEDSFLEAVEEARAAAQAGRTVTEKLDRLAEMAITRMASDTGASVHSPLLRLEIWAEASKNPHLRALCARGAEQWEALVADLLREGQRRGEIVTDASPEAVASILVAVFDGLSMQESLTQTKVNWPRIMQTLRQVLGRGILVGDSLSPDGEPGTPRRGE